MKRSWFLGLFGVLAATAAWTEAVHAQGTTTVNWIWSDEGNPTESAPAGTRYFRRVFDINRPVPKPVDEGLLDVTADDAFTVWVNGVEVGKGDNWKRVYRFDVKPLLVHGKNVIAVRAENKDGSAGILVRLGYIPNGYSKQATTSDGLWRFSKTAADGWTKADFDDSRWQAVKVIGPYGKAGTWKGVVWDAGGDDRFAVPPGFAVEMVVPPNPKVKDADPKLPFSLINMTFDRRGRLLVSREFVRAAKDGKAVNLAGEVYLCTEPDKDGVFQSVKPYCDQVRSCQGMCWVKDALLLVGEGPQGPGLYRVRDTDGDDRTDEVKLLHKIKGGIFEHGPHAIVHGPDGWLYLVIGNHAWAQPEKLADNSPLRRWPTGQPGPDQGKPNTTEDVLLPRLNDARGHAADILAPGGTIWRMDHEGKNLSLVAAGFRNHFDAAFSPAGELFTFDSDMEWDEALPWYRPVRICHCPLGADFVWRTGAANTPGYYIDSLPPLAETGRGSPVGLEFYDHVVFPPKYRGAYFLADWAIGVIYAAHLERDGATYKAKVERFCTGNPMNVTDMAVGPDGALYFTLGGRGTQGGVYRIVHKGGLGSAVQGLRGVRTDVEHPSWLPQPHAAWSRERIAGELAEHDHGQSLIDLARRSPKRSETFTLTDYLRALDLLQTYGPKPDAELLIARSRDKEPEMRAHAVRLLGVNGYREEALIKALSDEDALVRRRGCEALIRAGMEPPIEALWPLLSDKDRFVRTAARLVLERIKPDRWAERLWKESNDHTVLEGIVALGHTHQAAAYREPMLERLRRVEPGQDVRALLDHLRTVQLALIHAGTSDAVPAIAARCEALFPHQDWRVNRELVILLAHFGREHVLGSSVNVKLLDALLAAKDDRAQQIHFFYCLRLLKDGWTPQQKSRLLAWYDSTKTWKGGHSFTPFLEDILRGLNDVFTPEERGEVIASGDRMPGAATSLLRMSGPQQVPAPEVLVKLYQRLATAGAEVVRGDELKTAVVEALGRSTSPAAAAALRQVADKDPAQRDAVALALASRQGAESWPYLVRGLESSNPVVVFQVIDALKKSAIKPKPDDAAPYRALLLASGRLDPKNRWKVVELLRRWSNDRQFGAEPGDWQPELTAWSRWFQQTFPKEPSLPSFVADKPGESKYKFDELMAFLDRDPAARKGDAARGRLVFEKAQCIKCHKHGKDGEGIGPDLTTLSKRFKRVDILESILYPSRVISDQYRATQIETKSGQRITGLVAPQVDVLTVLQSDGTKVTLKKSDIEQQYASLISVMPEKLLDPLTREEIADLFAFLETEPSP